MRAFNKLGRRGFTLVELMIVVAIIGVLAALAIYGVRRYLASSKTSEAKNTIGAISRGATAAFERETAEAKALAEGSESSAASHALCDSAKAAVPAAAPKGKKYQPNTAEGNDYETGDTLAGWKCLKFSLSQPQYYSYMYTKNGQVAKNNTLSACATDCYEASAQGDLDADGTNAIFAITGQVNTGTGQLKKATQVYIENEFE